MPAIGQPKVIHYRLIIKGYSGKRQERACLLQHVLGELSESTPALRSLPASLRGRQTSFSLEEGAQREPGGSDDSPATLPGYPDVIYLPDGRVIGAPSLPSA
jgi:hypothetical protein